MEERFKIGVVTKPHGVHGEFNVYPTTDDVKRFSKLKEIIVKTKKEEFVKKITSVKYFKGQAILKLEGIDTMDDAELLRQAELYVNRKDAVKLEKNEYFIADLLDMKVLTDEGEELGIINDVLQTGANDVYIVKTENNEEIMIPAIKDCVKEVDVESGIMKVHILPGLLDL